MSTFELGFTIACAIASTLCACSAIRSARQARSARIRIERIRGGRP